MPYLVSASEKAGPVKKNKTKWGRKIQSRLMKCWEGIIRQQPFWETAERSNLLPCRNAAPLRLRFGAAAPR